MKHGSLFSGIGGFDLAADWMGWENLFHCEWNPFGQKVLKHYWPAAESFSDIIKTDFTPYANRIDVLTGGFPCQPYSTAGKRLGKEDERHLWPEMLRAIREISPRWVVGENVRGLISWNGGLVFDEVQADLEAAGYEILPFLLPACALNAPHPRYRIWFIAHAKDGLYQGDERELSTQDGGSQFDNVPALRKSSDRLCEQGVTSDADCINRRPGTGGQDRKEVSNGFIGDAPHAGGTGWTQQYATGLTNRTRHGSRVGDAKPTDWRDFPTQSPLCTGNDGIPAGLDGSSFSEIQWRNESIKAGGNAIVPELAFQYFQAIHQFETPLT